MRISCAQCDKTYEADDALASGVACVRCFCGATLSLRGAGGRSSERLGRYTLINQIAAGGMGEVWFARMNGAYGFEKEVAIKRLLPHFAGDEAFSKMFFKEAKVTALMNHPNVAEVYDLAEVMGQYLIVMEYVPGISVNTLISTARRARIRLPREIGIVVALQTLRGLRYAHRLDWAPGHDTMLHRDISPQNLLITRDATVKIVDFGIAKAATEVTTTAPHTLRGKLCYQAPERLRGGTPTVHVDLYPTAIVLYECWAMFDLFRGTNQQEIMRKILAADMPPISHAREDIPPALEAVLERALDIDPDKRFPDADAFEKALLSACPGRNFEDMQARAARFLDKHASVLFAGVATHKTPPGLLPEDTQKVLLRAGPVPSIEVILRPGSNGREPEDTPADPIGGWGLGRRRQAWLAAGLTGVLAGLAATLYFWEPATEAAGVRAEAEAEAPAATEESLEADAGTRAEATPEAFEGAMPEAPLPSPTPAGPLALSPLGVVVAAGPTASAAAASAADPCASVGGSGLTLAVREATGGLLDLDSPTGTEPDPPNAVGPSANAPSDEELARFFRRRGALLARCFEHAGAAAPESVVIRIDPTGALKATFAGARPGRYATCFEARLRRFCFRSFEGPAATYVLSLRPPSE